MNGAPAKPMRGVSVALSSFGHEVDRCGHVGDVVVVEVAEAFKVRRGDKGLGDNGPSTRDHVDAEVNGVKGHDDVGEEDRGVDPVAANGLQRHFGRQLQGPRSRRGSSRSREVPGTRVGTDRPGA